MVGSPGRSKMKVRKDEERLGRRCGGQKWMRLREMGDERGEWALL
jgi:hypothetical protein